MPTPLPDPAGAPVGPVSHAVSQLARRHKEVAGQLLREVGLHPGQELLLMQLWHGGPQRQVDVGRILGSDAATITRSVQRLERAGLVSRSPNATDARSVIIAATPASEALRPEVERVWRLLEDRTVVGMSAAQRAEALQVLQALEGNLGGGRSE